MNSNCKKSCGCGNRDKDVKYIKKYIQQEDEIMKRLTPQQMASVPTKNKLQIQVDN